MDKIKCIYCEKSPMICTGSGYSCPNCLLDSIDKLEKENLALTHLAINFIKHSVDIRAIQMKCFAGEYKDVKHVGISMPSYQTTALHKKLKAVSEMDYDEKRCGEAIDILLANKATEQG